MANDQFYFYRCHRCSGIITRLQFNKNLETGSACDCGSGMISPTNLRGSEWFQPAVLKMVALKLLGQLDGAPPPSEPHPVPLVARNVPGLSNEEKWVSGEDE